MSTSEPGTAAGVSAVTPAHFFSDPHGHEPVRAELFGLDRLADLLEREAASGQSAQEMLRRLVCAVLDHQVGGLRDDATLLLVQWAGPAFSAEQGSGG